jgi:hypothetical protein
MKKGLYIINFVLLILFVQSCGPSISINKGINTSVSEIDELIWYEYIGARTNSTHLKLCEQVAKEWGFTIKYIYGSCCNSASDKNLKIKCDTNNQNSFNSFRLKYGDDWQKRFYAEVEKRKK